MAKIYIEAPEIAQRLQEVHLSLTKGKRRTSRSIVLSRETFNRSAGRDTVEDPVYLTAPYTGQDTVLLSDTPFEKQRCAELTFEFTQPGN